MPSQSLYIFVNADLTRAVVEDTTYLTYLTMSGADIFSGVMDGLTAALQNSYRNDETMDRLANSFNELFTNTPIADASFLGHYQILFEVAYPVRANWPAPSVPNTGLRAKLASWVAHVRRQVRFIPRQRHTFMSLELFPDLLQSLPVKIDIDSWVADVVAEDAFIQTAEDLQRMLLHMTQVIADDMACLVADLYDRAMRNRGEALLLSLMELQKASREMLGEEFFLLSFDEAGTLRPADGLSDEEFIALRDFNTVLTESNEEILASAPGGADEMTID